MKRRYAAGACVVWAAVAVAAARPAHAQMQVQTVEVAGPDVAWGPVVRNAPYSGDGVTTVKQQLADGTRIERTLNAKLYRDSSGRSRRERAIVGLEALDPERGKAATVTILDPVKGVVWSVNPGARTVHRLRTNQWKQTGMPPPPPPPPPAGAGVGSGRPRVSMPPPPPPPPAKPVVEALGERTIDGFPAKGSRSTITIPVGQVGNDRPIVITEERWESLDLQVMLSFRRHDPRTGEIEYRLTNIVREEPAADLFEPPADYTMMDRPAPPPPPPPPPPR